MSSTSNEATAAPDIGRSPGAARAATPAAHLYRVAWRWHLYAGLFVIPFLVVLALSGGVYLFKPQLDRLMYPQTVAPAETALLPSQQLAAAQVAYPGATVTKFKPAPAPDRSAEVLLTSEGGRDLTVFVDPYTARVLGERDEKDNLQYYALKLHTELLAGDLGDRAIEIAACWAIVLLISGLYLWWPRKAFKVWGTLLPRLDRSNRRIFYRDLHVVPGFWAALLVFFMLITGLPATGFWGEQFVNVWGHFPEQMWDDVPRSTSPKAASPPGGGQADREEQRPAPAADDSARATLDSVVATAERRAIAPGYSVGLPQGPEGVYTVSVFPDDPAGEAMLHIDQYSGDVLADIRWQQYGVVPRAVELGLALHEGRYFGLANQLLMLGACVAVVLLAVTGTVMWWTRRPKGRIGAPATPRDMPLWRGAAAIMVVLGAVFPLMGLSLLAVLALDHLLVDRIPALRRILA
ncbi:PepSY-associated TM helix domain-containing protein [Sorangium sp. So ce1151]|uniref:PepSY-associated TM helix domain-containing protein n=1 Tax=Sorangium sp. So ce1151 TaxID=3133332 RepID=UPI003F62D29F